MIASAGMLPRLTRRAWVILAGDAVSALGSGLTLPFLIVYLTQVRGIGVGVAGTILSMVALAGLLGNPLGGWLVDRVGARRAVIVGLVVAAAGTVALALVHAAWHGFLAAGLYGLGMAVLLPSEEALLATAVPAERRPQVFALRHATLNAGFSVGALVAAVLVAVVASPAGFVALYLLDAMSFLVFAVVVGRLPDLAPADTGAAAAPATGGYRKVLRDRVFCRVWLVVALLVTAGYAQFHAGFPAFVTSMGGLSPAGLGVAFAANMLTVVCAQLIVLRLMSGCRRTRGVALSVAFMAAAWGVTLVAAALGAASGRQVLFVAAMVLFGLGETLLSPTVPAIVNDLAPDRLRGRYNGAYSLAWTGGYIAGPALAGFALAADHAHALFVGLILGLAVAGAGAWRLERWLPTQVNRIAPASDRLAAEPA
jgi:MFS family permease